MRIKKIISLALAAVLTLCMLVQPAMASGEKTETVYAMLNQDGSVNTIYVVNHLTGEYTDYGQYSEIKNLSSSSTPIIDDDKISFPDDDIEGGFFYQGTTTGELPVYVNINYFLDGQKTDIEALAGASGRVGITIDCGVNEKCAENVRDGYMAQISLTLKDAANIMAEGATTVAAGRSTTIGYVVLSGENESFSVEADVSDFEMDGITITLLKGSIGGMEDTINSTKNGFDDMLGGAEDMVDGTSELKDGVNSLVDAIGSIKSALSRIVSSGGDINQGMQDYASGLSDYINGVSGLSAGSAAFKDGMNELASNADAVSGGIASVNTGLGALDSSSGDLRALAQSLLTSGDPNVQALAQGTLQTLDSISGLSTGLDNASAGVQGFASGVKQAAQQYGELDGGLQELSGNGAQITGGFAGISDGFSSYLAGIKKISSGAGKLYTSVKEMPEEIQKLLDGQIDFRDGIAEAKDELTDKTSELSGDTPTVSFADPKKNHPSSVQYIMKTPGIKIPKQENVVQEEDKNETFLSRLIDLFI